MSPKPLNKLNLITIHLGGGCSITAVKRGRAVDTSMGFTPLEGLVMGTRSGDIDPGILIYLAQELKWSWKKIEKTLVYQSGLKGLTGYGDMLKILGRLKNQKVNEAFKLYTYRIQKYIGAYLAVLGSCNAVVFTGAIGAGKPLTRNRVVRPLKARLLKATPILAVPPDEEKMIAMETMKLAKKIKF